MLYEKKKKYGKKVREKSTGEKKNGKIKREKKSTRIFFFQKERENSTGK
jgi:hypothetical protein